MMNIKTLLTEASALLKSDEAAIEAQLLLQHLLNVNRAWLIAHANDALEPSIHAGFQALIARRLRGEPIAYILGYREFYGLTLKVTPDTLIPRPDTETLVDAALEKIPADYHSSVLDLGTGTGAIALAIAKNRPAANVTAVDFSEAALEVARLNAATLNITNITFIKGNWLGALEQEVFDLIVSNPPYIEQSDAHLNQGDLRFEPLTALASGEDGLDDIRTIIQQAKTHLKPHGWLMLEHGYNQAELVADLLRGAGFMSIRHVLDLANIRRVTIGCVDEG
jgi:release factor glutamine methyltransferase